MEKENTSNICSHEFYSAESLQNSFYFQLKMMYHLEESFMLKYRKLLQTSNDVKNSTFHPSPFRLKLKSSSKSVYVDPIPIRNKEST